MRKSREEAAETRKRIVTAAAGEFREHGIVATGIEATEIAANSGGGIMTAVPTTATLFSPTISDATSAE